jgi:predicted Zn-dependent protease
MKKYIISLFVTLFLAGCGYVSSTQSGAVGVERKQLMLVSASQMEQGARQAYTQMMSVTAKKGALNQNKVLLQRVRTIANRLIPQTAVFRPDAPNWQWEVNVITSKELNAWCMPGGKIAFYTGIIETLKLTDSEIAAIMGHEIAHALREHGRERASQGMVTNVGLSLVSAYFGLGSGGSRLAQMAVDVTLTLPNSRGHEQEADRMGVELAARAGYDPYAAVNVWKKMSEVSTSNPPEILSTHPSHTTRIADLKVYAKRVEHLYHARK